MEDFNRDTVTIPYFVHEGVVDRADRVNKRLVVALVIAIVLLFVTNMAWLYAWNQYDYIEEDTVTTTYDQDGSGTNIIGNHNEVNNGSESNDNKDQTQDQDQKPDIFSR